MKTPAGPCAGCRTRLAPDEGVYVRNTWILASIYEQSGPAILRCLACTRAGHEKQNDLYQMARLLGVPAQDLITVREP